jgi:hypothetical protein
MHVRLITFRATFDSSVRAQRDVAKPGYRAAFGTRRSMRDRTTAIRRPLKSVIFVRIEVAQPGAKLMRTSTWLLTRWQRVRGLLLPPTVVRFHRSEPRMRS